MALAAAAALTTGAPGAEPREIRIGMSAAFTGAARGLGIELYRGTQAYLEHVNRTGGVAGRKVVLRIYDDGYNPGPAVTNTIQLVERDRVLLLCNYVGTPTVTRVLPLLKSYAPENVFLFFPFTGAGAQRQPPYDAYVFNLRASYEQETTGLVRHFLQLGRRRIGIFYQADAYGRSGWDGVRTALREHGLKIAAEATYRRGTEFGQSMARQVEILRETRPDAVVAVGAYPACAAFARDARGAGWDVPIANISFVGSESLLRLLDQVERAGQKGVKRNLLNSQVVPSYEDLSLPAVRQYRTLMDRYRPRPPSLVQTPYEPVRYSFVSFEGFLNARLLMEVLRRMKDPNDRAQVRAAAEALGGVDLGIGVPASIGPTRHQALDHVYYTTVRDGRFVPVTNWSAWRAGRS